MSRSEDKGSLRAVAASVQGVHDALLEGSVGYFLATFFEARFRPAVEESAKSPLPLADLNRLLKKSYLQASGGEGDMTTFNHTMEYLKSIYNQAPDTHDNISFYDQNRLFFLRICGFRFNKYSVL